MLAAGLFVTVPAGPGLLRVVLLAADATQGIFNIPYQGLFNILYQVFILIKVFWWFLTLSSHVLYI